MVAPFALEFAAEVRLCESILQTWRDAARHIDAAPGAERKGEIAGGYPQERKEMGQ